MKKVRRYGLVPACCRLRQGCVCKSMSVMGGWRVYDLTSIENKKLEIKLFLGLLLLQVMTLLMQGNKERTQEPTAANKTSSRSHAVLQVTIQERNRVRTTRQSIRTGKLFMIDLAGSERASHTKVMCYDKTKIHFHSLGILQVRCASW